ncbi:MAG: hypothetical protein AAF850_09025, partial [Pseudomonadota bacterium]
RTEIWTLLEATLSGEIADALDLFRTQYDAGADPAQVIRDALALIHLASRVKAAGEAAAAHGPAGEADAPRAIALAQKTPMNALTRAWSLMMRGLSETQSAPDPAAAAEMALVRLAYAADLPTPDEALKRLKDISGPSSPPAGKTSAPGGTTSAQAGATSPQGGTTSAKGLTASRNPSGPANGQSAAANRPPDQIAAKAAPQLATQAPPDHIAPRALGAARNRSGAASLAAAALPAADAHMANPELANSLEPARQPASDDAPAPEAENATVSGMLDSGTPDSGILGAQTPGPGTPPTLYDFAEYAAKERDAKLVTEIERYVRVVSLHHKSLRIALDEGAPADLPGRLTQALKRWTGEQWIVTIETDIDERNAAGETIRERRERETRDDPLVKAAFEAFPDARILSISEPYHRHVGPIDIAAAQSQERDKTASVNENETPGSDAPYEDDPRNDQTRGEQIRDGQTSDDARFADDWERDYDV